MLLLHGLLDDHTGWMRRSSLERYCDGTNLLVVMPSGGRGFYADAAQGPQYETALSDELPRQIQSWFTMGSRWFVAGLSMGGYGALRFALKHPERFTAAASMSGAVTFGEEKYRDAEFERIVPDAELKGNSSLFALAKRFEEKVAPHLWLDCGLDDSLLPANRRLHSRLNELGIDHVYEEPLGGHDWSYWDNRIQKVLQWFQALNTAY